MNDAGPELLAVNEQNLDIAAVRAAEALRSGELIVVPTETVYGVAAHPEVPDGLAKLYEAKSRDRDKPIAFLASDLHAVADYGARIDPLAEALASAYWPGPLTLVLNLETGGTEGFRIPDNAVALAVLRASGGLLRVSSANASGDPDALTADAALEALSGHVSLVLDAGPAPGGVASTVVRIHAGKAEILRAGAVAPDAIHREVNALQNQDATHP